MKTLSSFPLFRRATTILLAASACLMGAVQLRAQTAVSNFGQGSSGVANVGSDFGFLNINHVFSFTTGASSPNFDFTSVTMAFNNATGSPGSLSVGLYSAFNTTSGASGLLTTLSASSGNPASAGNVVFSGSTTLAASTTYYLLLSAPSASTTGNYFTYLTPSTTSTDAGGLAGWSVGTVGYISTNGGSWSNTGGGSEMSVQASAIPEPSTYAAIAGAAMLGLAAWKRRKTALAVA